MNRVSSRHLSRLEKRAPLVVVEQKRRARQQLAWRHQAARVHATKLATLILHGAPHVEEPLAIAWDRALKHLGLKDTPNYLLPSLLYAVVIAALPGETENAKFARVFSSAPPWLPHFCMACLDCFVLGFDLPKSSEPSPACGWDGFRDMKSWPDLPRGTMGAGWPMPRPNPFRVLSSDENIELIGLLESREENWSRRDRRRYGELMAKVDRDELARALMPVHLASTNP